MLGIKPKISSTNISEDVLREVWGYISRLFSINIFKVWSRSRVIFHKYFRRCFTGDLEDVVREVRERSGIH